MITKFNRNRLTSRAQMELKNTSKGYHWFKPDTLAFFEGKIESISNKYGLFVSSEQFVSFRTGPEPRMYSVRQFRHDTGQVETVGEFQQYSTYKEAIRAIEDMVERADELSTLDLQFPDMVVGLESINGEIYLDGMLVALDD